MSNLDCNIFCERAKELFGERGQIDLAESIGISQGVISAIKRNAPKAPSADTVYRIAKYFNVSADWLLGLSDVRSTDKATKELCDTLGLSEYAIFLLQDRDLVTLHDAINWLIDQHANVLLYEPNNAQDPAFRPDDPLKRISILSELAELLRLQNSQTDVWLETDTKGVYVRTVEINGETLEYSKTENKLPENLLRNSAYNLVSLINYNCYENVQNINNYLWNYITNNLNYREEKEYQNMLKRFTQKG